MAGPDVPYPDPDYSARNYKPVRPGPLTNQTLGSLATFPADARVSWKNLTEDQRNTVLDYMGNYYGDYYAEAFVKSLQQPDVSHMTLLSMSSAEQANPVDLSDAGYRIATDRYGLGSDQLWVRPDGKMVWVPANVAAAWSGTPEQVATPVVASPIPPTDTTDGDLPDDHQRLKADDINDFLDLHLDDPSSPSSEKENLDNGDPADQPGVDGGHTMLDPSGSNDPEGYPTDNSNPAFAAADNTQATLMDGSANETLASFSTAPSQEQSDSDSATIPLPGTDDPTAPPAIMGIALDTLSPLQSSSPDYSSATIPLPGSEDKTAPEKLPDDGQVALASFDPGQMPAGGFDSPLAPVESSGDFLASNPSPLENPANLNMYGATTDSESGASQSILDTRVHDDGIPQENRMASEPISALEPNRSGGDDFGTPFVQPTIADAPAETSPPISFPPPPSPLPASFEPETPMSFGAPEGSMSEPQPFEPAEPPMPAFTPSEPPEPLT
jgi:hypothetical protein